MKNRSGEKIKLASIDELLGVVNEESAMEIEISKIHTGLESYCGSRFGIGDGAKGNLKGKAGTDFNSD